MFGRRRGFDFHRVLTTKLVILMIISLVFAANLKKYTPECCQLRGYSRTSVNKSWTESGRVLQKVAVASLQGQNETLFVNIAYTMTLVKNLNVKGTTELGLSGIRGTQAQLSCIRGY